MSDVHDELEREYEDLQSRLGDPDLIADQAAYAAAAKRYNELEQIVQCIRGLRQAHEDVATAKEMLTEASGDDRDMLRDEVDQAESLIVELDDRLRELLLPKDPNDDKNVIVEIRGAEGGEEEREVAVAPPIAARFERAAVEHRPEEVGDVFGADAAADVLKVDRRHTVMIRGEQ